MAEEKADGDKDDDADYVHDAVDDAGDNKCSTATTTTKQ